MRARSAASDFMYAMQSLWHARHINHLRRRREKYRLAKAKRKMR